MIEVKDDVRALMLWEVVNCYYQDVALALDRCADAMAETGEPLSDAEQFRVAARLHCDHEEGKIRAVLMDATWLDAVQIAHECLLTLNGDLPDRFQETFPDLVEASFGPVGNYAETARLMQFATGPMPAKRYSAEK